MTYDYIITRDGTWPTVWSWKVDGLGTYVAGQSFTLAGAQRAAVRAVRTHARGTVEA